MTAKAVIPFLPRHSVAARRIPFCTKGSVPVGQTQGKDGCRMELEWKKCALDAFDIGAEQVMTQEETAETIVPDYCPDIARIIDGEGRAFLHRRELAGGRAELAGAVRVTLLYVPEGEGGIRSLSFSVPFAAQADGMGDAVCLLAEAELEGLENRLLNPRKVFTRCRLALRVSPCRPAPLHFCSDVSAPPELGLEKRQESRKTTLLTAVAEKDFPFTDTWALSAGKEGAAELLSFRCDTAVSECRLLGEKCLIKGVFPVSLLYRTAEGKCCRAGAELPFSQILELGGEAEGGAVELRLQLCGCDCQLAPGDEEGRSVSVTLSLHATALLRREVELTLLSDLYSTAYDLSYEAQPLSLTDHADLGLRRQSGRELLEVGVVAETLLDLSLRCGSVTALREGEGGRLHCPCRIRALYLDEGGAPLVAERSVDVSCPVDWPEDGSLFATARCPEEPQGSLGERGIEVRFVLEFHVRSSRKRQRASIVSATPGDAPADLSALPSLVLRGLGPEEDLWSLAKRCRSTVPIILAANGLEREEDAGQGQLLLVPRKRV